MPEIRTLRHVSQGNIHIAGVSSDEIQVMQERQNRVIHQNDIPTGGYKGDLLSKKSDANFDLEWITPATAVEEDNTKPITSAAVYTEIGNINALLETI